MLTSIITSLLSFADISHLLPDALLNQSPLIAPVVNLTVVPCLLFTIYKLFFVLSRVQILYWLFLRRPHDLAERYGRGSWVVVTGSSGGIGLAFAVEFAKRGFNIVLMSRSQENLDNARRQVLEAALLPLEQQVKTVVIDFSGGSSLEFWNKEFLAPLEGLDVSVLVNNVGVNFTERVENVPPQVLLDMMTVNSTSQVMATRLLLDRLKKRTEQDQQFHSAIISVSSMVSQRPVHFLAPYCATKSSNDMFSRSLSLELEDDSKIDCLSCRPAYVATKMSKLDLTRSEVSSNPFVLTSEECARGVLDKLGYTSVTWGNWRHNIYAWTYLSLPNWEVKRLREARLRAKSSK